MTDATPELNKALAAFQSELPTIAKTATADAGSYKYDYAPLDHVSDETLHPLGKHGLALSAFLNTDSQDRLVIDYVLLHASGEERSGRFPLWMFIPERFKPQDVGGYVTFWRRYILGAVTGVAPGGEDNDAAGSQEVSHRPRPMDVPPGELRDRMTRTRTPGPEHEQLRAGTVEYAPDDKPTERGQLPPEQDAWADQPAGEIDTSKLEPENVPGSADTNQLNKIHAKLRQLAAASGTDIDAERGLKIMEDIVKGSLGDGPHTAKDGSPRTSKNLSWQEAKAVQKELDSRIRAAKAAADDGTAPGG